MMRDPIEAVAVIVPAHDEEAMVGAALRSVSVAARRWGLPVLVVVVLDSCGDSTEDVVRAHVRADRSVEWVCVTSTSRRASSSRDSGLRAVARRMHSRVPADRIAVLSTDADSVVPAEWIVAHVRSLDAGRDAVAGVVDLLSTPDDLSYDMWRTEYTERFRADGSHPHVHCANLAVRLDVLLAAGGFGHRARAEDIDLWRRIGAIPTARLQSDQTSVVRTSARRDGRVDGGFATALRQFSTPLRPVASRVTTESVLDDRSLRAKRARLRIARGRGGTARSAAS